jgi:hypothetical protein
MLRLWQYNALRTRLFKPQTRPREGLTCGSSSKDPKNGSKETAATADKPEDGIWSAFISTGFEVEQFKEDARANLGDAPDPDDDDDSHSVWLSARGKCEIRSGEGDVVGIIPKNQGLYQGPGSQIT